MKKITAVVLGILLVLSLAGCGSDGNGKKETDAGTKAETQASAGETEKPQAEDGTGAVASGEKVVIGYSSNQSDENENSKMQAFRDYVDEWNAAGNTPELEAVVTVAEGQVEKQMGDVESMVEMGAAGIALSSVDPEGLKTTAQSLIDQKIPVIEMRGMELPGIITFNLCDEATMAEMAYDWYSKQLDADSELELKIGLIYGTASQTAQLVRIDHLVELLEENYPGRITVVAKQYCDWDTQKAMECMENWLQSYPDGQMNCVIAAGAMMACGASNAIIGANGTKDGYIITATDATADVLHAINEGTVDMTVGIDAYKGGYLMAQVTAQAALGEFTDDYFDCGTDVLSTIDAGNIGDWYTGE